MMWPVLSMQQGKKSCAQERPVIRFQTRPRFESGLYPGKRGELGASPKMTGLG